MRRRIAVWLALLACLAFTALLTSSTYRRGRTLSGATGVDTLYARQSGHAIISDSPHRMESGLEVGTGSSWTKLDQIKVDGSGNLVVHTSSTDYTIPGPTGKGIVVGMLSDAVLAWIAAAVGEAGVVPDGVTIEAVDVGGTLVLSVKDSSLDASYLSPTFVGQGLEIALGVLQLAVGNGLGFDISDNVSVAINTGYGLEVIAPGPSFGINVGTGMSFTNGALVAKAIVDTNRTGYESVVDLRGPKRKILLHWTSPYLYTQFDSTAAIFQGQSVKISRYAGTNYDLLYANPYDSTVTIDGVIQSIPSRLSNVSKVDLRDKQVGIDFNWQYRSFTADSTELTALGMPFSVQSYQGEVVDVFKANFANGVVVRAVEPGTPTKGSIWFLCDDSSDPDTICTYNGTSTKYYISN